MKSISVLILACLLLASCYAPNRNCKDFKTGTFTYETTIDGAPVKTKFVRKDSIEIEYFQGDIDTSSVRWINDCEYILTKLHPENRQENKAVQIKILTTSKNTYEFQYSIVGSDAKQKGVAKKVE